MNVAQSLFVLVERSVADLGYELVDLERAGGGLLRVSVDVAGGARAVSIDDCERVTRQLSHLLTVENVDYGRLEVGSPGVDRRLRVRRDFARFAGAEIDVRLRALRDGRRRLRGRLLGVAGDSDEGASIRLALSTPDRAAGVAGSVARGIVKSAKSGSARPGKPAGRENGDAAAAPAEIEVTLAEIETARLVPELNFKGLGRGATK